MQSFWHLDFSNPRTQKLTILFFCSLVLAFSVFQTFRFPYMHGRDAWFHILVSRAWLRGENGMICDLVMTANSFPYAPLFHLVLLPFVSSEALAVLTAQLLQVAFYVVGLLLVMALAYKYAGFQTSMFLGLLLLGTYFAYGMFQTRPQALVVLLFPVLVWSFLEKKKLAFVVTFVAIFYFYSPLCVFLVLGLVVYALQHRILTFPLLLSSLAVEPILLFQLPYVFGAATFARWLQNGDTGLLAETVTFFQNPLFFVWVGLGVSMLGFAVIPYTLFKTWDSATPLDKVMVYSFFGFWGVFPIWYQRVFQFATIPLAYFTAKTFAKQCVHIKLLALMLCVMQAVVFTVFSTLWMSKPPYFEEYW